LVFLVLFFLFPFFSFSPFFFFILFFLPSLLLLLSPNLSLSPRRRKKVPESYPFPLAVMLFKLVLCHILKIRGTLLTQKWQHPEDFNNKGLRFICSLFTLPMMVFGPILVTGDKCDKYVRNVLEHELPLLFVCSLWKNAPLWLPTALTYFTYFRMLHGVLFGVALQPFRTLSYLPTFAIMALCSVFGLFLS
jgi:hypothetical protein